VIFIIFKSTPEAWPGTTKGAAYNVYTLVAPWRRRGRGDSGEKYSVNISNIPVPIQLAPRVGGIHFAPGERREENERGQSTATEAGKFCMKLT